MEQPKNRISLETLRALEKNTAVDALGIELVAIDDDHIDLRMPITDAARQPMGLLHGGVSMVLAESAASLHACWFVDLTKKAPVGIEINGSHVRSASEGNVRAVGRVLRRTRTLIFHQVDITLEATGELLSTARVTNYYRPWSDQPPELLRNL
jgi:uncharacterized protein (TIGR00369 family)